MTITPEQRQEIDLSAEEMANAMMKQFYDTARGDVEFSLGIETLRVCAVHLLATQVCNAVETGADLKPFMAEISKEIFEKVKDLNDDTKFDTFLSKDL